MEDNFLKLTNKAYQILDFLPESDPLKSRAKDKALVILDNLFLVNDTSGWTSFGKEKIKADLKHWGAWSEEERNDHEENKRRIVWCAAWNIKEELREEKTRKLDEVK
jgi:hypothetical protein